MTNPRTCNCGEPGHVTDTRQHDDHTRRRYRCRACGVRWATTEVRNDQAVAETTAIRQIKDKMADQLIELAQKLMK